MSDDAARLVRDRIRDGYARQGFATCPECGKKRRTPTTLAVHRALAHDVPTGWEP